MFVYGWCLFCTCFCRVYGVVVRVALMWCMQDFDAFNVDKDFEVQLRGALFPLNLFALLICVVRGVYGAGWSMDKW